MQSASKFNGTIGEWDTSQVTTMGSMFNVRLVLSLFGRLCAVVFDSSGWCLGPVIIHVCICVCVWLCVVVWLGSSSAYAVCGWLV
jgi:surface protein